jgi:hypothetical protein
MLALAWNHEEGDSKNSRVLTLLSLRDNQLRGLRRWLGPLTSEAARERIDSVLALEELGLQRRTLLLMLTTDDGRASLEGILANRAAASAQEAAQMRLRMASAKRESREIAANYKKHRPEIARALDRAAAMPEYQNRIPALSYWLHRQVSATGRLPQGVFHVGRIRYKYTDFYTVGDVDCDALFPFEQHDPATGVGEAASINAPEPASGSPDA